MITRIDEMAEEALIFNECVPSSWESEICSYIVAKYHKDVRNKIKEGTDTQAIKIWLTQLIIAEGFRMLSNGGAR